MNIKVLGSMCGSCRRLEHNVRTAIQDTGSKASVEKVQEIDQFIHYGIARIPALVINEKVYTQGIVLSVNDIKKIIEKKQ